MIDAQKIIETLWRRYEYIRLISDKDGSVKRESVIDQMGVSESTVYKRFKELEERNLVKETYDQGRKSYELTMFGGVALDKYMDLKKVCDFSVFLSDGDVERQIPQSVVSKCDFYPSEPYAPQKPIKEVENFLERSDKIRSFASTVIPTYVDMYYDNIMGGTEVEIVCCERVMEHLKDEYSRYLYEALDSGRLEFWVTDRDIPFGLVVASDGLRLVTYYRGNLVGVMSSNEREAINWGMQVFQEYKESSELFEEDVEEPSM